MKIALYIEDGLEQIVLTPDSETEKAILGKLHDSSRELSIKRGTFYGCQGGWTRFRERDYGYSHRSTKTDDSTMIVLRVRDSDRDPEGAETGTGSVGEADRARAEGIAQPIVIPPIEEVAKP